MKGCKLVTRMRRVESERPIGGVSLHSRVLARSLLNAFMRIEKLPVLAESEPVGHARDVITSHTVETLFRDVALNVMRKLLLIGRVGVK